MYPIALLCILVNHRFFRTCSLNERIDLNRFASSLSPKPVVSLRFFSSIIQTQFGKIFDPHPKQKITNKQSKQTDTSNKLDRKTKEIATTYIISSKIVLKNKWSTIYSGTLKNMLKKRARWNVTNPQQCINKNASFLMDGWLPSLV